MSAHCMQELHFVIEKILDEVWPSQSLRWRALASLSLMSLLRGFLISA